MIKCLFLVEGPFDKQRLSLLNALFDSNKIVIIPFNCDKLSENNYYKKYINDITNILKNEKTYTIKEFDVVVQICDLDGCFILDKNIIENKSVNKIKYYLNRIEAIDRETIIKRNEIKRNNIENILKDDNVKLFYNATNIDHVYDEIQNPSNKQKRNLAINMYNKYKNKPKELLKLIFEINRLKSTNFIDSWIDVKKNNNSLLPTSNLIFFIDHYKNELKEEILVEFEKLRKIHKIE